MSGLDLKLNRNYPLFAGSDGGGENWAVIASLIETCKLRGVDPQVYLADVLGRIVNSHLNSHLNSTIYDLMLWAYAENDQLKAVASEHRLPIGCGLGDLL